MTDYPRYSELPISPELPPRSAWGVFGEDDQLGTLNFIEPEQVSAAARLVRRGEVFPLNWEVDKPSPAILGRRPLEHTVVVTETDSRDDYFDRFYPQGSSQWDALSHVQHPRWGFYNGFEDGVPGHGEGEALGIQEYARRGIAGRFILADVARARERRGEPIDPSRRVPVSIAEIAELLESQGTEVRQGDVLMVRFGWIAWYEGLDRDGREALTDPVLFDTPGLAAEVEAAEWLWDNRVAAIAADVPALEAMPFDESSEETFLHHRLIPLLGMAVGEMIFMEELAADCAATGVHEGLFTAAPINMPGGVGSPANAVAIV